MNKQLFYELSRGTTFKLDHISKLTINEWRLERKNLVIFFEHRFQERIYTPYTLMFAEFDTVKTLIKKVLVEIFKESGANFEVSNLYIKKEKFYVGGEAFVPLYKCIFIDFLKD